MSSNEHKLVDHAVHVIVDLRVYRLTAVKKASYRLADRCTAVMGEIDGERLPIAIRFGTATSEESARAIVRDFYRELLDQELREQIAEETSSVRALVLAQAFSNVDLIKRDG